VPIGVYQRKQKVRAACIKCSGTQFNQSGRCTFCERKRVAEWRINHPTYNAQWRHNNPGYSARKSSEWHAHHPNYNAEWRSANPDGVSAKNRRWNVAHPAQRNALVAERRAKKIQATPSWAIDFIISESYELARLRTKMTGFKWHVDHIVPLRSKLVCGLHVHNNLQVIPATQNIKKGNRYWPDMPT